MAVGYQQPRATWSVEERDRLIVEHLPQVRLIAMRIHERLPKHVCVEDLISAGVIGLIAAIDNFDPTRNVKLRTFAEHKIRGYILNALGQADETSRTHRRSQREVQKAIQAVSQRIGAHPEAEDIAKELNLSLEDYHELLNSMQSVSLGTLDFTQKEDGEQMARYIADPRDETPHRLMERRELQNLLARIISTMPEMERVVLNMYYRDELTLKEIASVMNLHLTRISQIKTQAVLRLRGRLEELWPGKADI